MIAILQHFKAITFFLILTTYTKSKSFHDLNPKKLNPNINFFRILFSIRYRDPKYSDTYIFPAKRLKGVKEPPRVLKPQDFEQMNRGGDNQQWRPRIGFGPQKQVASLGNPGHRMIT